jgi:hypothetical protein
MSCLGVKAQINLVPDPSFEDTIGVNMFMGQGVIRNWNNLDSTSLAKCAFVYFGRNVLASNGYTLPNNYWFYQDARHGDGVITITAYNTLIPGPPQPPTIRGTARVKLKSPLIAGKNYCAKMYVSPLEIEEYFTNGIGMYFDNGQLDTIVAQDSSGIYPFVNPQVQCGFIIDDTLNWKPVQGTFTATGIETFLTIANFLSDANTQKSICDLSQPCECSEIIIDDVSLIATDISNWLHDTTIVFGDSVYIGLPLFEVSDAMWYTINMNYIGTGSGIKVKPTQAVTKYIQAIDVCNSIRYDTMTVYAYPLGITELGTTNNELIIYPNPSKNKFQIISKTPNAKKELYNSVGQLIISTYSNEIDVSGYSKGVYYLKCGRYIRKLVVE